MKRTPSQLFPLDPAAAEVVFAPFHDPMIAPSLPVQFEAVNASGCRLEPFWCYTHLVWDSCRPGREAATLTLKTNLLLARYDELIFCLILPKTIAVRFEARVEGRWKLLGRAAAGTGTRMEVHRPIKGRHLSGVRVVFKPQADGYAKIALNWFGLAQRSLLRRMETNKPRWNPDWSGLILPEAKWSGKFARGLLFDAGDLPKFRAKKRLPGWREHFAVLETRAEHLLQHVPETDLGEFLPWSDARYLRARETGREPYFWGALTLGFVALVNDDSRLIRHALRYLMCMAHTTHWCQSAESRLKGSTWDQRCFLEEMTTMSCAILLDWFDGALTPRAKDLVLQAIWDKGLAIIERDMMKFEYVYHINQGPWFCRARVLGGLMIEGHWPRVGKYVERALADLREGLDHYVLDDGGTDEGVGYFAVTFQAALPALIAYGRARGVDARKLLPRQVVRSERFLATMSAVQPGRVLLDGDNTNDHLAGDAVAIMAGLFPGSVYPKILGACVLEERPFTYLRQYLNEGVMAFALGPKRIAAPRCILPTFVRLERVGQLTSFRKGRNGHSIRIHLTGCKANPSHSHRDKGAFTVELDGVPFLIDRGTVRYDDARCEVMHRSCLHNVLTPWLADGVYPDQDHAGQAIIPTGKGDARTLRASVDLTPVWRAHMKRCRRAIRSDRLDEFVVVDDGELRQRGRIALHLHAPWPFRVEGKRVVLEHDRVALEIVAGWVESATQREDLIDYKFEPVHHLVLLSRPLTEFSLQTVFRRL